MIIDSRILSDLECYIVDSHQLANVDAPAENEPLHVNPKQFTRILKRRAARAKLEADDRIRKERIKDLHDLSHFDNNDNDILLDEVLVKIIKVAPVDQWPQLELVSKQFKRCVRIAYRALTSLNLKNVFLAEFGKYSVTEERLQQFLAKLIRCCPFLHTISGFGCYSDELGRPQLELLRNLSELRIFSFKNCILNLDVFSSLLKNFPLMKSLEIRCCRLACNYVDVVADHRDLVKNDNVDKYFNFCEIFHGLIELTFAAYFRAFSGGFLSIINAENLKVLNFSGSKFDGTYVCSLLNRCTKLETLYLYDPLTSFALIGLELEVLQCLPNLPKLREFELHVDHFHDGGWDMKYTAADLLNILVECKSLRELRLKCEDAELVTDDFLQRLIRACPRLEKLMLDDVRDCVSPEIMSKIADLENLTSLCIEICEDRVLSELFPKLDKLSKLSCLQFDGCDIGEALLSSLKNLQHLTSFTMNTSNLTEKVVREWVASGFLKKLESLKLDVDCAIADTIVTSISENVPVLKKFTLFSNINDITLVSIADNCPCLEMVNIRHCFDISEKGLIDFLSKCSCLKRLYICANFYDSVSKNVLFLPYKYVILFNHEDD